LNSKTFQWRSLKTRATLLSLVIVLTGLWSLSFYVSWTLRTDMQRLLSEQQLSTITQRANNLNAEMTQRLRALEKMAAKISPAMLEQPAALNAFLADCLTPHEPFSDALVVTQLDGAAITKLPPGAGLIDLHDMAQGDLAKALAAGKPGIGDPMMNPVLRVPVVAMAVPIFDPQGKILGALTGLTDLGRPNFLDKITHGLDGITSDYAIVAPKSRLVVTATDTRRVMEALPAPDINPQLDRFAQGYEGSALIINAQGIEVLASARRIPVSGWYLTSMQPSTEAFAPVHDLQQRVLIATLLLSLLVGVLIWWLLWQQLAPMSKIANRLARLPNSRKPLQPLTTVRQDEIGDIVNGFNHLLKTLTDREEVLSETKRFLKESQNMAGLGSYVLDVSSGLWKSSDVFDTVFGIDSSYERTLAGWVTLIHPDDRAMMAADLKNKVLHLDQSRHKEYRIIRQDDQAMRWVHSIARLESDDQGRLQYLRGTIQDITDRKQMEVQMRQLAFYDPLTKLPNRRLFSDRLTQTMATSKRSACHCALIFLDLDNFKPVNDIHGHDFGDLLLIEVANRLKFCVREMDTVGRLGGDEFVLLINELDTNKAESISQARIVAEKVRLSLAAPYLLSISHPGKTPTAIVHRCTASIGVVVFVSDVNSQNDILKWADIAMYQAKEAGRDAIQFYDPGLNPRATGAA
jgi:diguanylate cyclase (GGDEF)-like protein/PAS domain S-box-containing protein